MPSVPGCWPLRVSTLGPGSQYPSCFTDEKADLQKAQQLKPHSKDTARPGLRGRQPDAGSAPEPTAVLPAPPCRRHLAASSGPRPHTGGGSGLLHATRKGYALCLIEVNVLNFQRFRIPKESGKYVIILGRLSSQTGINGVVLQFYRVR